MEHMQQAGIQGQEIEKLGKKNYATEILGKSGE